MGNQDLPVGNQRLLMGNQELPVGNQELPVGNQGLPMGNQGLPMGNQGPYARYHASVQYTNMEIDYPWSAAASPMSSWHAAHG